MQNNISPLDIMIQMTSLLKKLTEEGQSPTSNVVSKMEDMKLGSILASSLQSCLANVRAFAEQNSLPISGLEGEFQDGDELIKAINGAGFTVAILVEPTPVRVANAADMKTAYEAAMNLYAKLHPDMSENERGNQVSALITQYLSQSAERGYSFRRSYVWEKDDADPTGQS